ncbi:MAG: energy transducer TonB [Candidatus Zixiibacteriota bacterium]
MKRCIVLLFVLCLFAAMAVAGDVSKKSDADIPPSDQFIKVEVMPECVKKVEPAYPAAAVKAGIEGDVYVQAYVDKTGKVLKANALKCSHKDVGFEEAAVKAAYGSEYKPATQGGDPVGVWVSYKVSFKLDDHKSPE